MPLAASHSKQWGRRAWRPFYIGAVAAAVLLALGAVGARAETFDFGLYWGPFPVGSARLHTGPAEENPGLVRTVLTVRTSRFVDLFIKVRDRLEGVASAEYARSHYYAKSIHEGGVRRSFETRFDWEDRTASYVEGGAVRHTVHLPLRALDPLSVFFGLRSFYDPGESHQKLWASDGKNLSRVTIRRSGSEPLELPSGSWDATILDVHMPRLDGIFRTGEGGWFRIWISADERRVPLKIEAGVVVGGFQGSMTAELEEPRFDSRPGLD